MDLGIHELKAFLTASGLLAAVLVFWIRLRYEGSEDLNLPRGRGIAIWNLTALVIVLISIVVAICQSAALDDGYVRNAPIGLLMGALFMTLVGVGERWFVLFMQCLRDIFNWPLDLKGGILQAGKSWERNCLYAYLLVCALFLIGGPLWWAYDSFSSCSCAVWFLVAADVIVIVPVPILTARRIYLSQRKPGKKPEV